MKRMQRVFGHLDALRYVDNRLDDGRRAAFIAHLAEDPREAERVAVWSRQNDVIRAAFAGVSVEPVPVWLRLSHMTAEKADGAGAAAPPESWRPVEKASIARLADQRRTLRQSTELSKAPSPERGRTGRRSVSRSLAAAIVLLVGILVVYAAHLLLPTLESAENGFAQPSGTPLNAMMSRASDAYRTYAVDPVNPVEVPAAQTALLDRWLQRRLAVSVRAPDLHPDGWTLLGGRLVPGDDGPGAYFIYENGMNDRLGIYVARAAGASTGPLIDTMSGGGSAMAWTSGTLGYVLTVGKSVDWLSRNAEMLKVRVTKPTLD